MSMRGRVVVTFGLIGACLQALLAVGAANGQEESTDPFSFVQEVKLLEGKKVAEDQFGSGVAVHGDTVLVGVPADDEKGVSAGAVHVFLRDNEEGVWKETQKLTASNGAASNFFGASVAVNGDIAFVGARGATPRGNFSGAVYVFARGTDGIWTEVQILNADDGAAGNFFGWSLTLTDALALIGARGNGDDPNFAGAAYVFARGEAGQWTQRQKLMATDAAGGDGFGFSVALVGETILIGAPGENEKGSLAGAAYLFTRSAEGQWTQRQKLLSEDGASGDEFGYSVALAEAAAVVGARFARKDTEDPEITLRPGAVYVFGPETESNETLWREVQKLTAEDGLTSDEFGGSVAASEKAIVVGSRNADVNGSIRGASYVFTLEQESEAVIAWTEHQKILAKDGAGGDAFGASIALSDKWLIVGSPFDDLTVDDIENDTTTTFTDLGSAHVLALTSLPADCEPKTDYDEAECSDTFFAASLTDLDEYVARDFGRSDNNGKYRDLNVTASLSDSVLVVQSPCEVILDSGVFLIGDFVNVDGRNGVSGRRPRIEAKKACILSERGNVSPGDDANIEAGELTLQAGEGAIIGDDAIVTVDGALTVKTVGDAEASAAVIDSGAVVNAGSVQIESPRSVEIRDQSRLSVDGALSLVSTSDDPASEAVVGEDVQILATDLTVASSGTAKIDDDVSIRLSGNGELVSKNEAVVNKDVTITVTGSFRMEAGSPEQCKIKDAQISAGATSGNCL